MNWRTTWILMTVAVGLFLYIVLVERHTIPTTQAAAQGDPLLSVKPADVTTFQIRRDGELFLRADRTNGQWQLSFPLMYPAQSAAITGLLLELSQLDRGTFLSPDELDDLDQSPADFELDTPRMTLVLQHAGGREELRFGAKTTMGDRIYVQREDSENIYVVNGGVFDRIPRHPNDWRDRAFIDVNQQIWTRIEMKMPNRGYVVTVDTNTRSFFLSQPTPARANTPKILSLLAKLQNSRVEDFINDNPRADLEPYGLQPPVAELVFGFGTNDLMRLLFGNSPTNDPSSVYAMRMANTNVVLVSKALMQSITTTHDDLREKRLLTLQPDKVNLITVQAQTNLVLRREGPGAWVMDGDPVQPADLELVQSLFAHLGRLEGEVERDVVTEFEGYGLAKPALQYHFISRQTNEAGMATNEFLGRIDFGSQQEDKVFVRRSEEQAVYSIPLVAFNQLPMERWQFRHRSVWSFSTNEVRSVTLKRKGRTIQMLRTGPAKWELAPGSQGIISDAAVEEALYRLGTLKADFWVARGEDQRPQYGLEIPSTVILIELTSAGGDPVNLKLEFGQPPANNFPFAMTLVDGHPQIFEFPKKMYLELVRDLLKPFWKGGAREF